MTNQKKYSQFFTPVWAAEILFTEHFSHLTDKDLVWEPSCGVGNCLSVIPNHIPAIGTELDPELAAQARYNTGRDIFTGDFRSITFPGIDRVTALFGNPPFKLDLFEQLMIRCENILNLGNKAGFILPAYFFQTSGTFMRFARKWEIDQQMIPRDLFKTSQGLSKPIMFATFIRNNFPQLYSFRLYKEMVEISPLTNNVKDLITNKVKRSGSVWKEVVITIAQDCGGTVALEEIYSRMAHKRPTANPFWKEQVRKVVQQAPFKRVDTGTYQLITI